MSKKQAHKKQKKQLKKKQKAKARQTSASTQDIGQSYTAVAKHAANFPLETCYINGDWEESGLAQVTLTRRQPNGNLTFAAYLVDTMCLGVKDVMMSADVTNSRFKEFMTQYYRFSVEEISADFAHQLIYQAIDYAAQFEFKPHKDFKRSQAFLLPREQIKETKQITFGRDGKPTFIAGPYDNVQAIISKLERTAGKGNYNSVEAFDDTDWDDEEEDDDL